LWVRPGAYPSVEHLKDYPEKACQGQTL
jgi:hypothetical protein